ncbi:unnamed protein product [Pleuronectes platessa]|uniref:Uncharacterized protein n=1 Tax=Pleuronectes platessa TaxID=8262 RepID=A0A9N7U1C0_PLEPL|nr:unnamed protein product [Pleuronectes platessa]
MNDALFSPTGGCGSGVKIRSSTDRKAGGLIPGSFSLRVKVSSGKTLLPDSPRWLSRHEWDGPSREVLYLEALQGCEPERVNVDHSLQQRVVIKTRRAPYKSSSCDVCTPTLQLYIEGIF